MNTPQLLTQTEPMTPGELASCLTGRDYLSWSQVDQMRRCPRKFAFNYVEQVPPDFVPSSLLFGGAVHAAIEDHLRRRLEGRRTSHKLLMKAFRHRWDAGEEKHPDIPVRFNKDEDDDSIAELADRMLAAFLDSPLAEPEGRIIAIEEHMRATLHDGLPDIVARVDAIWECDGALHLIDYKTSRSRWTEEKAVEQAEQILLYHYLATEIADAVELPVQLHFGVLGKQKSPTVQLMDVEAEPGRIHGVLDVIEQVWEAIQAGNFYPSPSPMNCSTCPFKSRCPAYGE